MEGKNQVLQELDFEAALERRLEILLVCVGPSPTSERLVRATKRLADGMSGSWIALHVDTGQLSPAEHERVDGHLQLAQRLGAEVLTQTSHSLIDQVLETVAVKNVTRVVIGRTPHSNPLMAAFRPSLADAILHRARGVDVLVLSSPELIGEAPRKKKARWRPGGYAVAVALVALATLLGLPMIEFLNPAIQMMMFLAAVVGVAYRYGPGPSNFASVLSVICLNFLFVSPRFTLLIDQPSYWLSFFGLLLNGLLVSRLTDSVKAQSRSAQLREADALTLLAVSRDLAGAETQEELARVAESHLTRAFGASVVLFADAEGRMGRDRRLSEQDSVVAEQAFLSGRAAGKGTQTLDGASYQWHPLNGPTRLVGVAGLEEAVALGAGRREDLLEAILNQVSAALERRHLAEAAQAAELLQASERLQTALLNSVSHDLRIPLVSIQGALDSLQDSAILGDEERRTELVSNALSETDRLNRLVGNLLQKTRLDTGHLTLKLLPCEVEDLISSTVASLIYRWEQREVELEIEPELPLVPMDFVLIAQVLTNLLENSMAYSEPGSPIGIRAAKLEENLLIEVFDRGVGFEGVDVERLFERFERGKVKSPSGIGLGLSICRGLVEAHGGEITARPREGGGAIFSFSLPLETNDRN